MKKNLLTLLLLVLLLLIASAPAAASSKGNTRYTRELYVCTFVEYNDVYDWYYLFYEPYYGNKVLLDWDVFLNQNLIWQEIEGVLFPATPAVGSVWVCKVEIYVDCTDWCVWHIDRIVLLEEITSYDNK